MVSGAAGAFAQIEFKGGVGDRRQAADGRRQLAGYRVCLDLAGLLYEDPAFTGLAMM